MNNLISKLSRQQLPYKISVNQATILLSIKYFQILALTLYDNSQINESSLLFASGILKSIIIIPYAYNFTLILFCLLIVVLKQCLLIFCSILECTSANIISRQGILLIYYDSIIVQQIIALPELYLYIGLISYSNKRIAFGSFKFELIAPLCIFMIIFVSFIATVRVYFFRASNIVTNVKLLPKFSYLILLRFTLELLVLILSLDTSYPIGLAKIILGILIYIISLLELHLETIFEPQINKLLMLIISCFLLATLIQLLCLITHNSLQKTQVLLILLSLPIAVTLVKTIIQRRQTHMIINSSDYPLIQVIEELYEFIFRNQYDVSRTEDTILLFQVYSEHNKNCLSCIIDQHYSVIKLVQCLIMTRFKGNEKVQEKESLMLLYINFLCNLMMQPLIAYVELKKFEFKSKRFSHYYRFIRQEYNQKLKEKIEDKQSHLLLNSQLSEQQIEIKEIIQSFHYEELYLKEFIQLLNQKINVLHLQIKGVELLDELKKAIMKYGKQLNMTILKFRKDFNGKEYDIKKFDSINIIILKLMSLLYALILGDQNKALELEQLIIQICTSENALPLDTICNVSLLEDKVCLLSISMVKNRGKILNSNKKQLAKHFGFGYEDFHLINHINNLIPSFLVQVHDALLEQYLQTAQSVLFKQFIHITTLQQDGLLQVKQLKVDNNFNFEDDYVITGCISKVKEGSEYIIFDQSGKIISSTESIYHLMIQGIDQEVSAPIQTLNQCYIFFFFTEIMKIFQQHKITNKSYQNLEIEDSTTLITRFNISDFIIKYQNALNSILPHKRYQAEHRGSQYFQKSKTSGLQSESQSSFHRLQQTTKPKQEVQLLTITYQRQVEEIMNQLNEGGEATYSIKFILQYKRVGFEHLHKSYFLMEIIDFRSKEQLLSKRRRVSNFVSHPYCPRTSSRFKQDSFREDSKRLDYSSEQQIQSFALINSRDLLEHDNSSKKQYNTSKDEYQKSFEKSECSQDSSKSTQNKECHIFIDSNNIIKPLKILIIIDILMIIIMLAYLIINLIIIQQNGNELIINNKNINAPLKFNRQFFQVFSLSWISFLNKLNILHNSEYLLNQTYCQLKNISETTFQILHNLYPSFIQFEESGLLTNVSFQQLGQENQVVSYTFFILSCQNAIKQLLTSVENVDINYIYSLMTLNSNLYNAFQMCKNLISSYDGIYQDNLSVQAIKIEYLTLTMAILMLLGLFPQFYYSQQCQQFQRQLIFMIGRLKEKEAREQIIKFNHIKDILENKENTQNWRQINYTQYNHHSQSELISQKGSQLSSKILNRQPIVLNTRIQNTSINKRPIIILLALTYVTIAIFLICGYILYGDEIQSIYPFRLMTAQFITFSTNLDSLVGSGIVVKTMYSSYSQMLIAELASKEDIDKFQDQNLLLFKLFLASEVNFDANLTSIFEQIIISKQISDKNREILENLYKYDICQYLINNIPFCKYDNITPEFVAHYSQPQQTDDITNFYENGIKGVTSQLNSIIKQYYYYETANQKLTNNTVEDQSFLDSKEFNNAYLQHFLYTIKTIDVFIDIIQYSNQQYSEINLKNIQLYYGITGSIILILFIIVYSKWMQITHCQMKYLKLGLSLLPQKIMNDPYVLNTIKQLK